MTDARDLLASALERGGYKKKAIAERAGMRPQHLTDAIKHRRRLDANELFRLCEAMNMTPNDFFGVHPRDKPGE